MIICNYIEKQTDNRGGIFYHVQKSGSSGIFPYYPVGEHLFGHYDRPRSGQRGVARRHHLRKPHELCAQYLRSSDGSSPDQGLYPARCFQQHLRQQQEGKVIQIKYVDDANDVAVVKSIYIRYSA